MNDPKVSAGESQSRTRFLTAQGVAVLIALIGALGSVTAAWLTGKGKESGSGQPTTFTQTIINGFQVIGTIAQGTSVPVGKEAAVPAVAVTATLAAPTPRVESEPPAPAVASTQTLPKYEDASMRAVGLTASVGNGGKNTVVPVRIENKLTSEFLIAYDAESVTTVTSDTGETNGNTGGCNVAGVRPVAVSNLPKPLDPLQFTGVAAGASVTLQIGCFLATEDASKVRQLNINVSMLRVENDKVRRFAVNIDGIPVHH
jgi:hypothetical protein